jgi:hypothetical protein
MQRRLAPHSSRDRSNRAKVELKRRLSFKIGAKENEKASIEQETERAS